MVATAHRWSDLSDDRCMIIPFRQQPVCDPLQPPQPPPQNQEPLTLPQFYAQHLLPVRGRRISDRTRAADTEALTAWAKHTSNLDLRSMDWSNQVAARRSLKLLRAELQAFVRGMEAAGIVATTINKRLRHIRTMLRKAADPIDHALLMHVPDLGTDFTGTGSGWKMPETRQMPRDVISTVEMESLFHATTAADDPHLWKCIILLLWTFGARTEDTYFRLTWDLVDFDKRVMRFTAGKTSKLQGVPLTDTCLAALRSLASRPGDRVFSISHKGTWTQSKGWVPGYYTTWSRDILPAGRFAVQRGPASHKQACNSVPGVRPNLMFHHFRKTMLTQLNCYSDKAGNWVAAHYMPGVSDQFYDTPTERVTRAVEAREAERLPECFKTYFAGLSVCARPSPQDPVEGIHHVGSEPKSAGSTADR